MKTVRFLALAALVLTAGSVPGGTQQGPPGGGIRGMMAVGFMREKSQVMNQGIRSVLTPDQVKTFDAWIEERAQQMRQRRQGGPPPALR
jgi:hypothetical protein